MNPFGSDWITWPEISNWPLFPFEQLRWRPSQVSASSSNASWVFPQTVPASAVPASIAPSIADPPAPPAPPRPAVVPLASTPACPAVSDVWPAASPTPLPATPSPPQTLSRWTSLRRRPSGRQPTANPVLDFDSYLYPSGPRLEASRSMVRLLVRHQPRSFASTQVRSHHRFGRCLDRK